MQPLDTIAALQGVIRHTEKELGILNDALDKLTKLKEGLQSAKPNGTKRTKAKKARLSAPPQQRVIDALDKCGVRGATRQEIAKAVQVAKGPNIDIANHLAQLTKDGTVVRLSNRYYGAEYMSEDTQQMPRQGAAAQA